MKTDENISVKNSGRKLIDITVKRLENEPLFWLETDEDRLVELRKMYEELAHLL